LHLPQLRHQTPNIVRQSAVRAIRLRLVRVSELPRLLRRRQRPIPARAGTKPNPLSHRVTRIDEIGKCDHCRATARGDIHRSRMLSLNVLMPRSQSNASIALSEDVFRLHQPSFTLADNLSQENRLRVFAAPLAKADRNPCCSARDL